MPSALPLATYGHVLSLSLFAVGLGRDHYRSSLIVNACSTPGFIRRSETRIPGVYGDQWCVRLHQAYLPFRRMVGAIVISRRCHGTSAMVPSRYRRDAGRNHRLAGIAELSFCADGGDAS